MTFEEAVNDPRRPLSLTPREWMYSVEASLAEEEELVDGTIRRVASRKEASTKEPVVSGPKPSGTGVEAIDLGLDQLVSGCRLVQRGIEESQMADLPPEMRKPIENIRDLL